MFCDTSIVQLLDVHKLWFDKVRRFEVRIACSSESNNSITAKAFAKDTLVREFKLKHKA
jgi:hypothetical protein